MLTPGSRWIVFGALSYVALGMASAVLSNPVKEPVLQTGIRLAVLFLGGVVFAAHVGYEVVRARRPWRGAAGRGAAGAALGALGLAIYMVMYNTIERSRPVASSALVLIVWPVFAGILAFLAGAVVAAVMARWRRSGNP